MRLLTLLRHAESLQSSDIDKDRILSENGINQALAIAEFYKNNKNYLPDLILCSSATRTRQTIKPLLKNFAIDVTYLDHLYYATAQEIKELVECQKTGKLMIVSHNPAISGIAKFLYLKCENTKNNAMVESLSPSQMMIFEIEDISNLSGSKKLLREFYEAV